MHCYIASKMQLRLKIVYLLLRYFLGLKIVTNGYCGNDGFIFSWDLGINFLCVQNLVLIGF